MPCAVVPSRMRYKRTDIVMPVPVGLIVDGPRAAPPKARRLVLLVARSPCRLCPASRNGAIVSNAAPTSERVGSAGGAHLDGRVVERIGRVWRRKQLRLLLCKVK